MQRGEANDFIDEQMRPRWLDWKPTSEQTADWILWLVPYDYEVARNAVREHSGSAVFNKRPNPAKLRLLLAEFQPRKDIEKQQQSDPTVFVMYEGGGRGTLQPGYYFPVIIRGGDIMRIAEAVRGRHEANVGGEWKVYGETTSTVMVKMRHEIRAAITDGQG